MSLGGYLALNTTTEEGCSESTSRIQTYRLLDTPELSGCCDLQTYHRHHSPSSAESGGSPRHLGKSELEGRLLRDAVGVGKEEEGRERDLRNSGGW